MVSWLTEILMTNGPEKNYQKFLNIEKEANKKIWNLYLGSWFNTRKLDLSHDLQFKSVEAISMGPHDLLRFSQEIKKCLSMKFQGCHALNLTFKKNAPMFTVEINWSSSNPNLEDKYEVIMGINIYHSVIKFGREEDQYLYENQGYHIGRTEYYTPAQLEKFADDLEHEAAPYLKKPWWQFWK